MMWLPADGFHMAASQVYGFQVAALYLIKNVL